MTDDDIFKACEQHGAKCVYDAAYAGLIGDRKALRAVGPPRIVDLGEAHTIARIAYGCSRAEAKVIIESWRRHYNAVRPHSSLNYLIPLQCKQQHHPVPNRAVLQE